MLLSAFACWPLFLSIALCQAALIRTKKLRGAEKALPKQTLQDKAAWMQQVIEEEQKKPLQVSKEFITSYEAQERKEEERLDHEVERHIDVLKRLRNKVRRAGSGD